MNHLPIWLRVLLGVALVAFIAWRVHSRWRAASEYSEGMAAEERALRGVHAQLLEHPAWHRLWQALAARGIHVSSQMPQPGAFQFGLLALSNDRGERALRLDDPSSRYLQAYLQGPKKIVASLVMATGEVHVRDAGFGEWPSEAL
ncbi:MAG: hypothetical protein IPG04_31585 [Polyangiaceae bacterium]|nr:hypothetical protein [Polyangiaceae bacterium]